MSGDGAPARRRDAAALLRWYAAMGIDALLSETPIDRFAEAAAAREARAARRAKATATAAPTSAAPTSAAAATTAAAAATRTQARAPFPAAPAGARAAASPPPSQPPPPAAIAKDAIADDAVAAAAGAATLSDLAAALAAFDGCALKATARSTVFADGAPGSRVMLIGEAPGRDEDMQGKPFVGRAGRLLDRMLNAAGFDRAGAGGAETVYIANILPWRPPGNRNPTAAEIAACLPFTRRQIDLAAPRLIACLGATPTRALLDVTEGITRARGRWRRHVTESGVEIPVLPMLHPAYLLRRPAAKRDAWRDMLALVARLETLDAD